MTEKQKYLLQLFREIDEICKKHNLRYVMAGGSLIGVVRNEGFIPWDDDVDIYMPKADWDKLVELAPKELPPHRAVQCVDTDRNYTNTFPRYASTNTCAIHRHQIKTHWIALGFWCCLFRNSCSTIFSWLSFHLL